MTQQDMLLAEQLRLLTGEEEKKERSISMLDLFSILVAEKRTIIAAGLLLTCLTSVVLWLKRPTYKADATILPPQQQQSSLSMLASGALGSLAASSVASQLGLKSIADMYVAILKSRTISDHIIEKFHLQEVYRTPFLSDARKALSDHATFASKDSMINITVRDHDPQRAANLANAYIDELYAENSRLAVTDASQRRLFFEQQLKQQKDALAAAETALKSTQQTTGLLVPSGQAEVLVRSGAQFRAEIASREVQLQAMKAYATDENPQLQVLKREIGALQSQLKQIETQGSAGAALEVSAARLPEMSLLYMRKLRDIKYHETLYQLLAKQYESSRIDEAKQASIIQVVDRAVTPDKDSNPSKIVMIAASCVVGTLLGAAFVFIRYRLSEIALAWKASTAR